MGLYVGFLTAEMLWWTGLKRVTLDFEMLGEGRCSCS
jgi:hypothetical protein